MVFYGAVLPKVDGTIRICMNFRSPNRLLDNDSFPLPRILDCLDALTGASYFTTLDYFAGNRQMHMTNPARHEDAKAHDWI